MARRNHRQTGLRISNFCFGVLGSISGALLVTFSAWALCSVVPELSTDHAFGYVMFGTFLAGGLAVTIAALHHALDAIFAESI